MNDDNQMYTRTNGEFVSNLDLLNQIGGEPLEGSGFEAENPEPSSEWRDLR